MLITLTDHISNFLYTYILLFLLSATGIYFTVRSRFVQFRLFPEAWHVILEKKHGNGGISSFEALMVSTASRVGTGNIAGVATALALGGSGAIFWMWLLAILGSASAFVESTLGQIYKVRQGNHFLGGPSYYIQGALKKRWLGILFSVLLILCFAYGFNGLQSFNIMDTLQYYFHGFPHASVIVGLILAGLTAIVLFGGAHRISAITSRLVPVMATLYLLLALIVIITHITQIPAMFAQIFRAAFDFSAFAGGFAGSCVVLGVKRGLFSNEAGMGSGPNATSSADVSHPVKQGLVAVLSVFLDTIVICSASAIVLLLSGIEGSETLKGMPFMQAAMGSQFGVVGIAILTIAVFLFAFTSIIGNYYYTETNFKFITQNKLALQIFRCTAVCMVFIGAQMDFTLAWNLADILMGLMGLVNLYAILRLGGIAIRCLKNYQAQRNAGIDPVFRAVDIGLTDTECWK